MCMPNPNANIFMNINICFSYNIHPFIDYALKRI